jgi:hypothetical protein
MRERDISTIRFSRSFRVSLVPTRCATVTQCVPSQPGRFSGLSADPVIYPKVAKRRSFLRGLATLQRARRGPGAGG